MAGEDVGCSLYLLHLYGDVILNVECCILNEGILYTAPVRVSRTGIYNDLIGS